MRFGVIELWPCWSGDPLSFCEGEISRFFTGEPSAFPFGDLPRFDGELSSMLELDNFDFDTVSFFVVCFGLLNCFVRRLISFVLVFGTTFFEFFCFA